VFEEVIYLPDSAGETPVDLDVRRVDDGLDVNLAMVDANTPPQFGAVPKAVLLNELRFSPAATAAGAR